jgi:hypothetical protein
MTTYKLIVAVTAAVPEICKRRSIWVALVAALSGGILWLAIPSLALSPALAVLLHSRVTLWLAMAEVVALTLLAYAATVYSLSVFCFRVRKSAMDAHYFS